MRVSLISEKGRPWRTAAELFLVRLLTRMALRVSPRMVVILIGSLTVGVALSVAAAIRAWGNAALLNLREISGFFDAGQSGLSNSTHGVLLAGLPAIVMTLFALADSAGLGAQGSELLFSDRQIWQSMALEARHVGFTHEVLPRLPFIVLAGTPLITTSTLVALYPAERNLALVLIATWIGAELLRIGVRVRHFRFASQKEHGLSKIITVILFNALAGIALGGIFGSIVRGSQSSSQDVVTWLSAAAASWSPWNWIPAIGLAFLGIWILIPSFRAGGGFTIEARKAEVSIARESTLTGFLFPIASPKYLRDTWASPDVRWTIFSVSLLGAAKFDLTDVSRQILVYIFFSALMAFSAIRLVSIGPAGMLDRLRHHFEMGASPKILALRVGFVTIASALPFIIAVAMLFVILGYPMMHCIGLALTPVVAVLAAASIVARRGSLADSRLLILAFIQAFFCAVVYALFLWQTVFGMLGLLVIFGVGLWACSRKQKLGYPGVRR